MPPLRSGFSIEFLYKPFVHDNVTNLRTFNDNQQILHFMVNDDVFKETAIEQDEHEQVLQEASQALKGNTMPKSVVSAITPPDLQG